MRKVLLLAGLTLGLALVPSVARAQQALVYCPINLDRAGCDAIVAALSAGSGYPGGVDRAYDGTGGTVDLRSADLSAYRVFVVPSLADDAEHQPYRLLREPLVAEHLHAALIGGLAVWSGTPDQGIANRAEKDQLIRNLAQWAGASYAAATGPGLVALLDLSENEDARYDWLGAISPIQLASDVGLQVYDSVRALTATGTSILASGGGKLAYSSMAALVLVTPFPSPGLSLDAVGSTGTSKGGQVVLGTLAAGNTSSAKISTDRRDYLPGDTVTLSGTGWASGETVTVNLHEDPLVHDDRMLTAVADASGSFTNRDFAPEAHDFGLRFVLTATGETSGMRAQTTFTDGDAKDGDGTMSVSPDSLTAGQSGVTLTFTFAAPNGGDFGSNSKVSVVVPAGWTTPQKSGSGSAGYVTITSTSCTHPSVGTGDISSTFTGNTITITQNCAAKGGFTLAYGNAATSAPSATGLYTFTTSTDNAAVSGGAQTILVQPVVTVKIGTTTA